ncbi:hypothetical protein MNV49_003262 [Pseudohyphozyma bogoriensis]|nr:hypothetical protein MNV49_003262 [Pseudohyphozyma bogoriensis]
MSKPAPASILPPPAVAFSSAQPSATHRHRTQLRTAWAKLKRQVGPGSLSDSLGDPTDTETGSGSGAGTGPLSLSRRTSSWGGLGLDPGAEKEGRRAARKEAAKVDEEEEDETGVDVVVVENTSNPELWRSGREVIATTEEGTEGHDRRKDSLGGAGGGARSERSSIFHDDPRWWEPVSRMKGTFFAPRYAQKETELAYQKEAWITHKTTHIFGALFIVFNACLQIGLLPHPWTTWNKISNYAVSPCLSVPLVFGAIFNWPRRRYMKWLWQILVWISVWIVAAGTLIDMRLCGYYATTGHPDTCGNKDFMSAYYYATALPVISLFGLGQSRLLFVIGCLLFIATVSSAVLDVHASSVRNLVKRSSSALTIDCYRPVQFKAKQRAQIGERKVQDARRRFQNYVFHEVRVPLNTALLAVQNLKADNAFDTTSVEHDALDGSLQIMSQVLNDVLDFSRMEKGGFSSVSRPFSFHRVMRSIVGPLELDANARGLELVTILDDRVESVALKAAYGDKEAALGEERHALVIGDELRLRQVINNLTSNACKFTSAGGKITVTTSLVYPCEAPSPPISTSTDGTAVASTLDSSYLSDATLFNQNRMNEGGDGEVNTVVVRIEVSDTGVGIRSKDMVDNRLFSAYVQTEIGRTQGGKGTGLGLSLVRQIVSLSGGRLGVRSEANKGSTFWVELPFAVGPETRELGDVDFQRVTERIEKELATPNSYTDKSEYGFVDALASRDVEAEAGLSKSEEEFRRVDADVGELASGSVSALDGYRFGRYRKVEDLEMGEINHFRKLSVTPFPLSVPPTRAESPTLSRTPTDLSRVNPPFARETGSASPTTPTMVSFPSTIQHSPATTITARFPSSTSTSTLSAMPELALPASPPLQNPFTTPSLAPTSPPSSGSLGVGLGVTNSGSPPPSAPTSPMPGLEFQNGPPRVLVVDDDLLTRKLMSRMLTRLGCVVSTAENGAVALEMMLAGLKNGGAGGGGENFDVVFLDNQMPVCSGLQVVSTLKELGRHDVRPLLSILSTNAQLRDQEEYIERGASVVLTKPIKEVDLKRHVLIGDSRVKRVDQEQEKEKLDEKDEKEG